MKIENVGPPRSSVTNEGLEIEVESIGPPQRSSNILDTTEGLEIEESGSTRYQVLKRRSTKKGFSKILGYY
ncbi:hypothetical protein CEXT_361871 [Caerostris extrusa]|uniref:Uncharacterized protein n=1 Tax=Caerostris extrusa TaxID=172846 RepID=A0AAV4TWR9_CAEEX|nr:hypothetical protein CEXT_361871 [Caerostris extrusa]